MRCRQNWDPLQKNHVAEGQDEETYRASSKVAKMLVSFLSKGDTVQPVQTQKHNRNGEHIS
jgi:hypothetical protein